MSASPCRPVLHVLPAEPFGGIQVVAVGLALQQRHAGLDARLLFTNAGREARRRASAAGVPVLRSRADGHRAGRMLSVVARLHGSRAEILHLHAPPPWIVAALVIGPARTVVTHLHGPVGEWPVDRLAARRLAGRSAGLIAVSAWVKQGAAAALGCRPERIGVVYNGVEVPPAPPTRRASAEAPPTFGMATRLEADKGLDAFLHAAARIAELQPAARFRLAGEGPARTQAEAIARRLLPGRVEFSGFVEDLGAWWTGVDVALFTAPVEPFGLRLLEPLGHGVPVVAYLNGTGSDEVARMCRGVVTVPWGDTAAFARRAVALAASCDERSRLVREGREDLAACFSLAGMERAIGGVYDQALREPLVGRTPDVP